MIPEYKDDMRKRMEQASLNELMPEFDRDEEWDRVSARLGHSGKKAIKLRWFNAAAAVLLLAGAGALTWYVAGQNEQLDVVQSVTTPNVIDKEYRETVPVLQIDAAGQNDTLAAAVNTNTKSINNIDAETGRQIANRKKSSLLASNESRKSKANSEQFFNYYKANEFVCNGTQCPIEICIVQTFKCNNAKPKAVATCNTLNPDEAKQLRYKVQDKAGKDCKVTVDEIRIKRVSTGETIVLNSKSKPATAEELLSCITAEEQCSILAGIFDSDCNDNCKPHNLTIYNKQGDLILQ